MPHGNRRRTIAVVTRPAHSPTGSRPAGSVRAPFAVVLLVTCLAGDAAAQRIDDRAGLLLRELESVPLPRIAPPAVMLRPVAELAIPGPLAGSGPTLRDDRIGVRVEDGLFLVPFRPDTGLGADTTGPFALPAEDPPLYGLSSDGRTRARVLDSGRLVVETACRRCADGWNLRFRLRVPGAAGAPPLVGERRVFFGAGDNLVYCVRRGNGHRVWAHEAEGRIVAPLVLWDGRPSGSSPSDETVSLVLAVPDQPSSVLALDARTGERATAYDAGPENTIVGAPLVLEDGRIVVARQDYRSSDAALVLLEVVATPKEPSRAS